MSTLKKIALGLLILVVLIVVAAVVIVPRLIDVDRYRPEIVERIQAATGKPVEIGKLTLTLFPAVSIRVDDFSLGNPKGFPQGDLVRAKQIEAYVNAGALWNRQLVITSLELDEPEINLLQSTGGQWNFEAHEPAKTLKKAALVTAPSFTLGVISKINVVKGLLSASKLSASGRPEAAFFTARGFSSQLTDVDLNAFGASFSQSLTPPPGNESAGLLWWAPSVVHAQSPQDHPAAQGTIKVDAMQFQTFHITSLSSKLRLYATEIFLDDLAFTLYGGGAKGGIEFKFAGAVPQYTVKAEMSGVDVAKLLEDVPSAKGYMTGKMQGNIDLDGEVVNSPDPLAGMKGVGNVSIKNGNLEKLQLNKNLMQLAKLSNLGPAKGDPGSFSSISTDLNIAGGRITSKKINVVGNGVGADGSGSMTLAGAGSLDYQGVANIDAGSSPLTSMIAGLSGATVANGKLSMPFGIGGTLNAPKFIQKSMGAGQLGGLGSMLGGKAATGTNGQNPANVVQGIAGMFKKKN